MTRFDRIAELHEELAAEYRTLARAQEQRPQPKQWMSLREFATYSGKGESTIRKHIAEGMPCERIPQIRIQPEPAMAWLSSRRARPRLKIVSGEG